MPEMRLNCQLHCFAGTTGWFDSDNIFLTTFIFKVNTMAINGAIITDFGSYDKGQYVMVYSDGINKCSHSCYKSV
jgi:hypothetical protein